MLAIMIATITAASAAATTCTEHWGWGRRRECPERTGGRYCCLAGEAVFEAVEGFGEVVREPVFGVGEGRAECGAKRGYCGAGV